MKKLSALLFALLLLPSMALAQLTTVQGGTGTTSPSNILYGDGTLHLKSVKIGNNLTFSAGTLSALSGASSTLLSDNNTFSGIDSFTSASSNFSGTWQTFSPSHFQTALSGTNGQYLIFANGAWVGAATSTFSSPLSFNVGTNAVSIQAASATQNGYMSSFDWQLLHTATSTFSSPLVYTGSTNAVTCPTCNTSSASVTSIATTYPLSGGTITTSGTLSLLWGTTTPFSTGQSVYVNGNGNLSSVATTSQTFPPNWSTSGTFGALIGGANGTISTYGQPSFTIATSSWVGTTTYVLRLPMNAETFNGFQCYTQPNAATLNIQWGIWTSSTTVSSASSTINFNAKTLSLTSQGKLAVEIGTPAGSPSQLTCTAKISD